MKLLFMIFAILWASLALADDATENVTNKYDKFVSTVEDSNRGSPVRLMFEISYIGDGVYFGVGKENVDENIAAIEKYIKWTDLAKQKGDSVDKTVAVAKGTDPGPGLSYTLIKYEIYSGNGTHFLTITPGNSIFGSFKPLEPAKSSAAHDQLFKMLSSAEPKKEEGGSISLSEVEAKVVLQKLVAFKDGKIAKTNKDDYQ